MAGAAERGARWRENSLTEEGVTMQMRQLALASGATVRRAADGFMRLARLERVLALACILIPAFLVLFDGHPVRQSISEYYKMRSDQVFYFPLTAVSILFVVNGIVKERQAYNTILGTMLAGLILFNCDAFPRIHDICAAVFFIGNGVVILFFSSLKHNYFRASVAVVILAALLSCFAFGLVTLFWVEWVSLAMIAVHFFIESSFAAEEPTRLPPQLQRAEAAS
jgi:hypothetical protein